MPRDHQPETKFASQEIQLLNTTGRYTFPNDNFLNNKTVVGMWVQDNADDNAFAPSGNPIVPNDCIQAAILTVRKDSDAKILDIPLSWLKETDGDRSYRPMHIPGFNPGTSFVEIKDTNTFDLNDSIVICVYYQDPE